MFNAFHWQLARPSALLLTIIASLFVMSGLVAAECVQLAETDFKCTGPGCAAADYTTAGAKSTHVALVFGNNVYKGTNPYIKPLDNAENDAKDLAGRLEQQGFKVRCVLNAGTIQVGQEVGTLAAHAKELQRDANLKKEQIRVVVYFAGHGFRYQGDNYIVFSDTFGTALIADEVKAASRGVNDLLSDLKAYTNVHPFIIIDACRTEIPLGLQPGARGSVFDASPTDILPGFQGYYVLYSTSENRPADDGDNRFMIKFKDEIDAWGRDFSGIFTQTQTLLKATQRVTAFSNTSLASRRWRTSGDTECDRMVHTLASDLIDGCDSSQPSSACFKSVGPTGIGCLNWNSYQTSPLMTEACRVLLASPVFDGFKRCPSLVASAGARIQDGRNQITLASLSADAARTALAQERRDQFVTTVETRAMSATRGSLPMSASAVPINRRTQWNDLIVTAKAGAKGTDIVQVASGPPTALPPSRTRAVQKGAVLETVCDTHDCGGGKVAVQVNAPTASGRRSATTEAAPKVEIKHEDLAPRPADEVLILKSIDDEAAVADADAKDLDRLVGKYAGQPGGRIRVTGSFLKPAGMTPEDQIAYERDVVRAIARSQRVGERIARIGVPLGFKPATQLSSGETTLADLPDRSVAPVFVEFYKPD